MPGIRNSGNARHNKIFAIEIPWALKALITQFSLKHPIKPEYTNFLTQMAVARSIPAPFAIEQAVTIKCALSLLTAARLIAHDKTPRLLRRSRKHFQPICDARAHRRFQINCDAVLHRPHSLAHRDGQHALNLRQCSLHGWNCISQAQLARSEEHTSELQS